ncbi:hypothetical protein DFH28DRAFT_1109413 [Melampsora americana]|nr:hypothetical protein DFH28DRAFT_1109413 [Melampsora americana]
MIHSVCIAPAQRRKGLATSLLKEYRNSVKGSCSGLILVRHQALLKKKLVRSTRPVGQSLEAMKSEMRILDCGACELDPLGCTESFENLAEEFSKTQIECESIGVGSGDEMATEILIVWSRSLDSGGLIERDMRTIWLAFLGMQRCDEYFFTSFAASTVE